MKEVLDLPSDAAPVFLLCERNVLGARDAWLRALSWTDPRSDIVEGPLSDKLQYKKNGASPALLHLAPATIAGQQ